MISLSREGLHPLHVCVCVSCSCVVMSLICEFACAAVSVCSCLCAPLCSDVHTCRVWPMDGWRLRCCQELRDPLKFFWSHYLFEVGRPLLSVSAQSQPQNSHTLPLNCHWWSCWPSFYYSSSPLTVLHNGVIARSWVCTCVQGYKMHNFSLLSLLPNGLHKFVSCCRID